MAIKRMILIVGITLFAGISTSGQKYKNKRSPKVQVYLLLGQSNMAGRGKITSEYSNQQSPRVLMLTKNNTWIIAKHPLHFDKPKSDGVGPGLSFGMAMADAYPNDTIALVPCAVGGTSINKWVAGAYDKTTNTHPYDDALIRIKEAMKKGEIKGVIWLQGEADSGTDIAIASYLNKLEELINTIRKEVYNLQLPWVAGELGQYRKRYKLFNQELVKLPAKVPNTIIVSSDSLWHKGDTTHFASPDATIYGRRFAIGMLKLQKLK
jgi:hypothetical protein